MRDDLAKIESPEERTLIELIYESALGKESWRRLLPVICSQLGCQGVGVSLRSSDEEWPGHMLWDTRRATSPGDPSHWQNLILDDPFPYREMEPGKIYRMSDIVDGTISGSTSYFRDILEPAGYASFVCMVIDIPDSVRVVISLYRTRESGEFSDSDVELCQSLVPHMRLALRLIGRIEDLQSMTATYGQAIDRLNVGAMMLDRVGRILTTNAAARKLVEREDTPLRINEGRLRLHGPLGAEFDSLLGRILAREENGAQEVLSIPRTGLPPIGLLIRSCAESRKGVLAGPEVAVYLSDPMTSSMIPEILVGELFGLSPAEARLASRIAAGLTLADAALELGLSEASARTYSKRIYSKTGVCRQADLVRLLLRSVAVFAVAP